MKTAVHSNSVISYHDLNLSKRQEEVRKTFEVLGEATDRQVAKYLGYDINRITGRITELRTRGVVIECADIIGEFGKRVRVCRLRRFDEELFQDNNYDT